ncbi:MAG: bifunctional (p)ppGpp synthetase/guanosine-3',5'-bis(diphosphate) 3'-pyrophosphohydrolase [Chloroflexota bacterium]
MQLLNPLESTMISPATPAATEDLIGSLATRLSSEEAEALHAAYLYALRIHGDRQRPSGETYAEHGLAVAQVVAEIGVDDIDALRAAILHDVLPSQEEDKAADAALEKAFGSAVSGLVSGINNLDNHAKRALNNRPVESLQLDVDGDPRALEVIRKALLAIIEGDIRIILVRMADCLMDLRRASRMPSDDQRRIAYEAMHIYAPLANRLGVWNLKSQLEDSAFRFLEPEKYREIARRLDEQRDQRTIKVNRAAEKLRRQLADMGIKAVVTGRPKHIYSIYRKMVRKQLDFDQINDIQALRVILEPPDPAAYEAMSSKAREDVDRSICYQALGAVHSIWKPLPREFDDYIGSPKANGYKSLHTAVVDSDTGQKLEVQVRTQRMHEEAEKGIAAHWAYKEAGTKVSASAQRRIQNLRELLSTLQDVDDDPGSTSLLDEDRLHERIYVFTPAGDVVDLPDGSTPIDFAYQIHTEIGHRCRGARVSGRMVSLDYKLRSGDKVEIITAKRGSPNRDWMNPSLGYTGSARTRGKIRQWFRQQERDQNIIQGREVVERELKRMSLIDTYEVDDIALALKYDDVEDFLCRVGFGDIQTVQITGAIAVLQQQLTQDDSELLPLLKPISRPKGLTVRGVGGLHTRMAGCCNPIAPEPIIGYVTRGQGVTIHRQDCKQIQAINDPERLIEVDWGSEAETHPVPVVLTAYKRSGLIEELVNVLRGQQINVPKTKLLTHDNIMTVYLIAEVSSLEQLNWLLTKLENIPKVIEARRQRWS